MSRNPSKVKNGHYIARCRSKNVLQAAANGHLSVWPSAKVVIIGDTAVYLKDGKRVWQTHTEYAAMNFDLDPLQAGWFTDSYNRAGTAHFLVVEGAQATSMCGRTVPVENLQPEGESLKKCARCVKDNDRFAPATA